MGEKSFRDQVFDFGRKPSPKRGSPIPIEYNMSIEDGLRVLYCNDSLFVELIRNEWPPNTKHARLKRSYEHLMGRESGSTKKSTFVITSDFESLYAMLWMGRS